MVSCKRQQALLKGSVAAADNGVVTRLRVSLAVFISLVRLFSAFPIIQAHLPFPVRRISLRYQNSYLYEEHLSF